MQLLIFSKANIKMKASQSTHNKKNKTEVMDTRMDVKVDFSKDLAKLTPR